MSKHVTGLCILGLGATLSSTVFAQGSATSEASGSASVSTSSGASTEGTAAAATPAATAETPYEPYEPGLPPEHNLFEMGIFGGAIFPSSDHNLRYQAYPQREYAIGAEFGARLGYYPLSFLGVEAEASE